MVRSLQARVTSPSHNTPKDIDTYASTHEQTLMIIKLAHTLARVCYSGSLAGLSYEQLAQLEFPLKHKQMQQVLLY